MGFQDRSYETRLAKSAWLLELADHWSERDPEFAEHLRMKGASATKRRGHSRSGAGIGPLATWFRAEVSARVAGF